MLADDTNAACVILQSCAGDVIGFRAHIADRVAALPRSVPAKKVMYFGSLAKRVLDRAVERFMRTGAAFEPRTPSPRVTHLKLEVHFDNGTVAHQEFSNVALLYQYLVQLN